MHKKSNNYWQICVILKYQTHLRYSYRLRTQKQQRNKCHEAVTNIVIWFVTLDRDGGLGQWIPFVSERSNAANILFIAQEVSCHIATGVFKDYQLLAQVPDCYS